MSYSWYGVLFQFYVVISCTFITIGSLQATLQPYLIFATHKVVFLLPTHIWQKKSKIKFLKYFSDETPWAHDNFLFIFQI
jgi:hypothetical protein